MKIKSIAALFFYVSDLEITKKFYERLGFRFGASEATKNQAYINWFSVELVEDASKAAAGQGQFVMINVEDVDEFYAGVKQLGMKPETEPYNVDKRRREFLLKDPDGYQLTFFQKK